MSAPAIAPAHSNEAEVARVLRVVADGARGHLLITSRGVFEAPAHADVRAAARIRRGLRHISCVQIDLSDRFEPRCTLTGLAHRNQRSVDVSLGVAIAFAAAGIPTTVRGAVSAGTNPREGGS